MFAVNVGWRLCFALGAVLGLGVLLVRRSVPESPRWLFIHGREDEAEEVVSEIERQVRESTGRELAEPEGEMVGNLFGPLILGRLFDTVGRKPMISGTYLLSGVLLIVTALLFQGHELTAASLTVALTIIFFFASAGVSAAYLTVSEIFPMETRAL